MSSTITPNEPGLRAPDTELALHWRSSRHARRLLTLALAGVFIAVLARRPEFAGVAAPALLLLAAGRGVRQPRSIRVRVGPSSRRVFEGELMAVDVTAEGRDGSALAHHTVRWTLHPGREFEMASAVTADGPRARFTFSP